jgi:hypothetical protein
MRPPASRARAAAAATTADRAAACTRDTRAPRAPRLAPARCRTARHAALTAPHLSPPCSITFRYNSIKSRLALMQARLQDINALVKVKNPSLLLQLQRAPPRFPSAGGPGGSARALPP